MHDLTHFVYTSTVQEVKYVDHIYNMYYMLAKHVVILIIYIHDVKHRLY